MSNTKYSSSDIWVMQIAGILLTILAIVLGISLHIASNDRDMFKKELTTSQEQLKSTKAKLASEKTHTVDCKAQSEHWRKGLFETTTALDPWLTSLQNGDYTAELDVSKAQEEITAAKALAC